MTRPTLTLTDEQARVLIAGLPAIEQRYPDPRANRFFVREFIRLVHAATGLTYSPMIYRRWLNAFAPGRNPSNTVLAEEKSAFVEAIEQEARAGRLVDEGVAGAELVDVVQRGVEKALAKQPPAPVGFMSSDPIVEAQRDFLQARLADGERALNEARAHAAQLAGELQAALAVMNSLKAQLAAANDLAESQNETIARLSSEVADQRRYAMRAIDEVRGETRAWKERCGDMEQRLIKSQQLLEVFRQAAYAKGASIPTALLPEPTR